MKYLEAPNYYPHYATRDLQETIFLAGSITGASNWQLDARKVLGEYFNLFNPRRENFDITDSNNERLQIYWEHKHLDLAEITLFYFASETVAPITLLEYGKQLVKIKYEPFRKTYVFIHPNYQRKNDVLIQTELEAPKILKNIYFTLPEMYEAIIKENT